MARILVVGKDAAEDAAPAYKFSDSLGECVNRLALLDLKADKIKGELKKVTEEYKALENHLIDSIPKNKLDGAIGKRAVVKLNPQTVPTAKDWEKTYSHIKRTNSFDLLHKRLSSEACNARWDNNKVIPGVEPFTMIKLKLVARKGA